METTTGPRVFALVTRIQDEFLRFVLDYHNKLRTKNITKFTLDYIAVIREMKTAKLLKHFKTISRIKEAEISELSDIVPQSTAENIYNFFRKEKR